MYQHTKIAHVAGLIGMVLTTVYLVPQIFTTYKTKTIKGLSHDFLLLMLFTSITWCVYAYELNAFYKLFSNIISIIFVIVLLIMYHCYKHNK